jgi:hypothetical protein
MRWPRSLVRRLRGAFLPALVKRASSKSLAVVERKR